MMKGSLDRCRSSYRWPVNRYHIRGDIWAIWDERRYTNDKDDADGMHLGSQGVAWTAYRRRDNVLFHGFNARADLIRHIDQHYE